MGSTDKFKETIQDYLNKRSITDPLFAKSLTKEGKSIDDCITYILSTVQKSGCTGFEDSEIFGMAVHYYDEDVIEVGSMPNGFTIVSNHRVELTDEDIAAIKQKAISEAIEAKKKELTKKKTRESKPNTVSQPSLF